MNSEYTASKPETLRLLARTLRMKPQVENGFVLSPHFAAPILLTLR